MKRIEIIVSANGETRIETLGFAGAECLAASRFLEQTLGKPVFDRRTSAYYQQPARAESPRLNQSTQ